MLHLLAVALSPAESGLNSFSTQLFLKFSFGAAFDYQSIKFSNTDFSRRLIYFLLLIGIHHLILFSLVIFDETKTVLILRQAVYSSIFTLILCLLFGSLFSEKET